MFKFIFGPWMIIPQAFIVASLFGFIIYDWPEHSGNYEEFIFFQGNIDMGGGCLFAGTLMLYLFFGFTAGWYLVLKLNEVSTDTFFQILKKSFFILKYHILAFVIGGTMDIAYDARVIPNDFRNMFCFAAMLYLLTIIAISFMKKLQFNYKIQLLLAPIFIIFWLYLGSDGNTSRAGQLVSAEKNPHYIIRSKKHSIMVSWHKLCDSLMGEIYK